MLQQAAWATLCARRRRRPGRLGHPSGEFSPALASGRKSRRPADQFGQPRRREGSATCRGRFGCCATRFAMGNCRNCSQPGGPARAGSPKRVASMTRSWHCEDHRVLRPVRPALGDDSKHPVQGPVRDRSAGHRSGHVQQVPHREQRLGVEGIQPTHRKGVRPRRLQSHGPPDPRLLSGQEKTSSHRSRHGFASTVSGTWSIRRSS